MSGEIPQQPHGAFDDGTDSGLIRVHCVRGPLIPLPFEDGAYGVANSGAGANVYFPALSTSDPDGFGSGINVITGATIADAVRITVTFYGRAFGVRFRRDAGSHPRFSVGVDGHYIAVVGNTAGAPGLSDRHARAITHDDLPHDGPHLAELIFTGDAGGSYTTLVFGILVDAGAGYAPIPRAGHLMAPVTLTTSAVEIPVGRGTTSALRHIRKVFYTNISGADATVTVKYSSGVIWQKTLAAGTSDAWDPGLPVAASNAFTHQASAGSAISATVVGY